IPKEKALLMWVFPVAKPLSPGLTDLQDGFSSILVEVVEDGRIVMGGNLEGLGRKSFSVLKGSAAFSLGEQFQEFPIVLHGGDAEHIPEVLGSGPDQGDAPDIDFFDDVLFGGPVGH